ncbi:hypothetical protein FQN54_000603 [Arachnomyces sp. PD_36]|nr:hypothetical protein FQN54_000603 [Arachnomyces sp. PD_36]
MGREDFYKQIENSEEFKILSKIANEADATVDDALEQVVSLSMTALALHGPDSSQGAPYTDYKTSLALLELAQRLEPAKHAKLVEFVSKLQKRTATDSAGNPLKTQGSTLWTDLPSLGYTELETWVEYGGNPRNNPMDPKMDPEHQKRWAKLNAFIAQLSQAADIHYEPPGAPLNIHPMDKSLHAAWTMQKAFEDGEHPPETLIHTAVIPAACFWFIYGSDRLWANVQNGRKYDKNYGAGQGSKYSEKDWAGFERERWDVWEQGLQAAKGACTATENVEVKGLIEDALAQMKRVMT